MAHKVDDKFNVLVDWTTGDPEGDRKHLFIAYRAFLREIQLCESRDEIEKCFKRWKVCELNIDYFPRINIEFPADVVEAKEKEDQIKDKEIDELIEKYGNEDFV